MEEAAIVIPVEYFMVMFTRSAAPTQAAIYGLMAEMMLNGADSVILTIRNGRC